MKVLIAPDSFKNSMSAKKAADAIYLGAKKVISGLEAVLVPLSDGGEGFTESLVESAGGSFVEVNAHDALMRNIKTRIGLIDHDYTGVVELAAAAGIELLKKEELKSISNHHLWGWRTYSGCSELRVQKNNYWIGRQCYK